jgi:hypothetical protein
MAVINSNSVHWVPSMATMQLVSTRTFATLGAVGGLVICGLVLVLMYFGVSGVLTIGGGTDLRYIFWPASLLLTVGWRSTPLGVSITIITILLNCALYAFLAIAIRAAMVGIRSIR